MSVPGSAGNEDEPLERPNPFVEKEKV